VSIKSGKYDARLNADAVPLICHDTAEIAGEINDQATAERFARQAAACAAGVERQLVLGCVANGGDDVGDRARPYNPQRLQLVDARVAGVKLSEQIVAADIAGDEAAEIFLDSLLVG
jgi:hypothetical protein